MRVIKFEDRSLPVAALFGMVALHAVLGSVVVLAQSVSVEDGIRAFHQGRYAEARRVLARFPDDARARTFHAIAGAATGACDASEAELRAQFERNEETEIRRLAGLALTQCLLARKDFNAAVPVLARLQQSFPKDADVLYETARTHMRAWNEAVYAMFQNAPASFRVNQLSAEVFETQGRFAEAIAEYRRAIQKNPAALNLHFRLGRALLMQSHDPAVLDEAKKEFDAELALNPADAAAEYEVGQILVAQQKSADAAANFRKALSITPDFPEAMVALAKTHSDGKRYGDAILLLERAVALRPRMESAHYALMLAYRNSGRSGDAMREKETLDKLQKPPEGEFTEFLKKLGEKPAKP